MDIEHRGVAKRLNGVKSVAILGIKPTLRESRRVMPPIFPHEILNKIQRGQRALSSADQLRFATDQLPNLRIIDTGMIEQRNCPSVVMCIMPESGKIIDSRPGPGIFLRF